MPTLDNKKIIKQYQKFQVARTISLLPKQIVESWADVLSLKLPKSYRRPQNIVVSGMGGSGLAAELLRSLYGRTLKIPLILVHNYHLPKFVNNKSLVVISSYSGQTEESLDCLNEALAYKAKVFCLASGGQLIITAKKHRLPYYLINKKFNPANQPRYGIGSQFGAMLALFDNLKLLKISDREIKQSAEYLSILNQTLKPDINSNENFAKKLARELNGQLPILIAADFLSANSHILANQINESAKNLAQPYAIPELSHHLLEGLKLPTAVAVKMKFLFFNSNLYSAKISRHFTIVQKILKKQKIKFIDYSIIGDSRLSIALEALLLSSWLSYYLAILNGQNPTAVPLVDYFKKELVK